MEKDLTNPAAASNASPPGQSTASTVLNGMGNGMMLGGIPFVIVEAHSLLSKKPLSHTARGGSVLLTVLGCALGAAYGLNEAKQLKTYRNALGDKVDELTNEVRDNRAKIDELRQQLDAKEPARAAAR